MRINVSAGHNPDGKVACGAVGLLKESTEARRVTNEVVRLLKEQGHTVYNCTCDNGTSQGDVLKKIVAKCNQHSVDLDVSIHFNAGASAQKKNGQTTGTEVLVYNDSSKAMAAAQRVAKQIAALGYKNRGIKIRDGLYFLRNTKSPAMLIECCFVDDGDDAALYDYKKMASAIVRGITGEKVNDAKTDQKQTQKIYKVQVGAYSTRGAAQNVIDKLKKAGFDGAIV